MIRRVLETFLYLGFGLSLILFLYNGLINPHLSYDEAGQFWLGKGLNHFSKLNAEYGSLSDVLKENRTFNLDPGGFSVIAFVWLKISHTIYWIRLLPLIFTGFSLYFFYKILRLLDLRINEALLICLYFFISKSLVEFSFTFRAYSMEMAGTLMSLYLLLKNYSNPISTSNLIRLSIVFNIFIWSRYGFIINILAINSLFLGIIISNKQIDFSFFKKYGLIVVLPLLISVFIIYYLELVYHIHANPVPMYQKNFTLKYHSFWEMFKVNFFSIRGLPFFIFIILFLTNFLFSFIKIMKELKFIFLWMIFTHIFSIVFSFIGFYPWFIKGRWGLTLEFISLFAAVLICIKWLKELEAKYGWVSRFKISILLIISIVLFNIISFSAENKCVYFLERVSQSSIQIAIVNWYLTPSAKYHISQNPGFKRLLNRHTVLFEGIDKIETYPRPQTWFLISNPDTTIAKLQFEKFKFRYKFIINGRNDQIIEVE